MNRTMSRQPLMPHSTLSRSDPIIACSTLFVIIYSSDGAVHVPFLSSDEIAIVHTVCDNITLSYRFYETKRKRNDSVILSHTILHTVHYTVTIRIAMQVLKYYKSTHYSQLCCAIILYIYTCTCTVHSVICIKYTRTYACTSECTYIYTHAYVNLT